MGKKGVWAARAFQFLGNSRPISARAKSTPVRRRSAASIPSATILLALDRRNRCCAGSRDFAPSSPFRVASFCTRADSHSLALAFALSPYATLECSFYQPPGAMEGLCTRSRRKTAGDDCGLRPRKTIAVGRRNSEFRVYQGIVIAEKNAWSRMSRYYRGGRTARIY